MGEYGIMKDEDCRQICALSLGFEWSGVERLVLSSSDKQGLSEAVRVGWVGEDHRPKIPPALARGSFVAEVHTSLGGI